MRNRLNEQAPAPIKVTAITPDLLQLIRNGNAVPLVEVDALHFEPCRSKTLLQVLGTNGAIL